MKRRNSSADLRPWPRRRAASLALAAAAAAAFAVAAQAQSLAQQWRDGLSGALLTAYEGSVVSSNSTLTTIRFCRSGRYTYIREGSWTAGSAGGAGRSVVNGAWSVQAQGPQAYLTYQADDGRQGAFPLMLLPNGRVDIGGLAYAVQQGGAEC